jgi:hypothetical protein
VTASPKEKRQAVPSPLERGDREAVGEVSFATHLME